MDSLPPDLSRELYLESLIKGAAFPSGFFLIFYLSLWLEEVLELRRLHDVFVCFVY
jgi:hypothetical protein